VPLLFDIDPQDRAPYAAGLVNAAAEDVPGAPVYHLDIAIDDSMTTVEGRQTVTYTNQEDVALNEIVFHLHPNLLDSAITVSDLTVEGAPANTSLSGDAQSILTVALPAPLPPGGVTTVALRFRTEVPTEIGRNYGVLAYSEGILALAHFYPMLSVYDATGWNTAEADIQGDLTYSDAAYYLVRVSAPEGVVVVASGVPVEGRGSGGAGEQGGEESAGVTYAVGPARDFYLAAGEFAVVSRTVGATTINSYAPAALADGAALALEVAAATLAINEARLSPFPYTELDIVTTPTAALGIEYPGLIVGTLRMYDLAAETRAGVPMSDILESTTAHEVVHQWFYNLVGNDQLDEPWLDESMTGYQTYRYYVDRYGQSAGDGYFANFAGRWESVDRAEIPIGLPVRAYEGAEYGAIVYGRGPFFLRELEETLGRETFDAFLRNYAATYRWGISDTAAFRALAEAHCACDLGQLFADWVYE
jgi:aminopeptidase N